MKRIVNIVEFINSEGGGSMEIIHEDITMDFAIDFVVKNADHYIEVIEETEDEYEWSDRKTHTCSICNDGRKFTKQGLKQHKLNKHSIKK